MGHDRGFVEADLRVRPRMIRPRVKGVVIPSEALVLSEAKELSAFPFLSSSTIVPDACPRPDRGSNQGMDPVK